MVFLSCQHSLSSKRKPNSCQRTLCSKNKTSLFWDNFLLQKLSVTEWRSSSSRIAIPSDALNYINGAFAID